MHSSNNIDLVVSLVADEMRPVTLEQVLVFATGAECVPPLGFSGTATLEFIHDANELRPSDRHLPTANTCSLILRLPLHSSYNEFAECMELAVLQAPVFGFA